MAMPAPLVVPSYTIEDLERFPDDGNRYELLDGILLVTPAPIPSHQLVISRLLLRISQYLEPTQVASAVGPGAVEIAPKTHLEPDLLVFPASEPVGQKWGAIRRWWLAVEVFSQSSRVYDREYKRDVYLAMGVEEVWLVDWFNEVVFASAQDGRKDEPHREELRWHPALMSSPLTVDLKEVFQGLHLSDYWGS